MRGAAVLAIALCLGGCVSGPDLAALANDKNSDRITWQLQTPWGSGGGTFCRNDACACTGEPVAGK